MKVVTLSVGGPREVEWEGDTVLTSIFKEPVDRRLQVTKLNLEGDEQSDLTVHGGVDKAVYVYPSEHYEDWRRELPGGGIPPGGLRREPDHRGPARGRADRRPVPDRDGRIHRHSAAFALLQTRHPVRPHGHAQADAQDGRTGFYFAVTTEGEVGPGDPIEPIAQADEGLTVADIVNLYTVDAKNQDLLRRATRRRRFSRKLEGLFPQEVARSGCVKAARETRFFGADCCN